ncbi:MAG TPA: D-2-hydroxyacid dehydrogenase [Steroidobacteraceae bacterium]|nr:D-2-hydroxyacid dehydrogenase [Steroidobacteraceae bacterium]
MRYSILKAGWMVVGGALALVCGAADLPKTELTTVPPDPKAVALIQELAFPEAATALREQPGWKKPKRIVLSAAGPYNPTDPKALAAWKEIFPGIELVVVRGATEMAAQAPTADALLGVDNLVCDDRVLAAAKNVRWIGIYSAGVESCLGKQGLDRADLTVTNMRAVAGPVMAEHCIGLMFALSRSLHTSVGRQARGEGWGGSFAGSEPQALGGKTLLVAGLGGIGMEVAKRAHALGMNVIATRNSSRDKPDFVSYVGLSDELPTLIAKADVVVSALPLVPATTNLFDAKMFARMKKSAYFINVGRGGSVVTDDLAKALNDGIIAGAGLDVTEPEPLPTDHPLWKARNIIITPHMSARSDLGQGPRELLLREMVRRFAVGDKMLSVVDFKKGY